MGFVFRCPGRNNVIDLVVVCAKGVHIDETGVLQEVGSSHQLAERAPLLDAAYGQSDPLVVAGAGIGALHVPPVAVARRPRNAPVDGVVHVKLPQVGQEVLAQGDVDVHTFARLLTLVKGQHGGDSDRHAGRGVSRHRAGRAVDAHVRVAGDGGVADRRFELRPYATVFAPGPCLPKAADRNHDEPGFHLLTTSQETPSRAIEPAALFSMKRSLTSTRRRNMSLASGCPSSRVMPDLLRE